MNATISIIIPAYNRELLISETLDSVLKQSYANWECIIVDDGSTDGTVAVITDYVEKDRRFSYYNRPSGKLKGPSACRNFGFEKAIGDYIVFLDSDDLLADFCLQNRMAFAIKNPDYDFWIFKMQLFIDTLENRKYIYGDSHLEVDGNAYCKKEFMRGYHPFVITCPLWKKEVLVALNGFTEALRMFEDPELHLRALKAGYKLQFSDQDEIDCFYRQISKVANKSVDPNIVLENSFYFLKIHLDKNEPDSIAFFKRTLSSFVFKNTSYRYYYRFAILGYKRRVLSLKAILTGIIILLFHTFGINSYSKLGYNKLRELFNKF